MDFSSALQQALKRKGWTQVQLARRVPCQKSTISQWIGRHRIPHTEHVRRLIDIFDDVEFSFAMAEWITGGQVGLLFGGIQGGRAGAAMRLDREMRELQESIDAATDALLRPADDVLRPVAMDAYVNLMEAHVACAEVMRRIAGEYGFTASETHKAFICRANGKGYLHGVDLEGERRAA